MLYCHCYAGVMELADVLDSKSSGGNTVRVRPPPPAPNGTQRRAFFIFGRVFRAGIHAGENFSVQTGGQSPYSGSDPLSPKANRKNVIS